MMFGQEGPWVAQIYDSLGSHVPSPASGIGYSRWSTDVGEVAAGVDAKMPSRELSERSTCGLPKSTQDSRPQSVY